MLFNQFENKFWKLFTTKHIKKGKKNLQVKKYKS